MVNDRRYEAEINFGCATAQFEASRPHRHVVFLGKLSLLRGGKKCVLNLHAMSVE